MKFAARSFACPTVSSAHTKTDAAGNPITYRKWDVNPYQQGVNRGAERIVTGGDGKSYYTNDHYGSFTPID